MAKEVSSVASTPRTALYLKQKPKSIAFYTPKIDVMYVYIAHIVGISIALSLIPIPSASVLPSLLSVFNIEKLGMAPGMRLICTCSYSKQCTPCILATCKWYMYVSTLCVCMCIISDVFPHLSKRCYFLCPTV